MCEYRHSEEALAVTTNTNKKDDDEEEEDFLKPIARRLSFAQPTPSAQNVIKCSNRENCGAPLSLSL